MSEIGAVAKQPIGLVVSRLIDRLRHLACRGMKAPMLFDQIDEAWAMSIFLLGTAVDPLAQRATVIASDGGGVELLLLADRRAQLDLPLAVRADRARDVQPGKQIAPRDKVEQLNSMLYNAVENGTGTRAKLDGVLRSAQPAYDGQMRDTASYSILRTEWPDVQERLQDLLRRS